MLAVIACLFGVPHANGQPTIVSSVPADLATGVSITAGVVFTFSEAMDTNATSATFLDETTFGLLTVTTNWNAGNTVLTCTPNPAFPVSSEIVWVIQGQDPGGNSLGGIPEGSFTTGTNSSGGGGGGGTTGTNKLTSFVVATGILYDQASADTLVLDTNNPYVFTADVSLASNRSALSATVTLPSGSVSNLFSIPTDPGFFIFPAESTNQTTFDTTFGNGDYIFKVVATDSNQQVTVDLPSSLAQPGAPQVANYAATQSVNPTLPFTLQWEAFVGGTASDYIYVSIGDVYSTGQPDTSNALPGTATSTEILANTLQTNMSYNAMIGFYHTIVTSNNPSYITLALREAITQFSLLTTTTGGGATGPLVLTNASWSGHTFTFDVTSAINQTVTIQYNTNIGLASSAWKTLLTTNSATGSIQVADSVNTGNSSVFYRAQFGP
jgi:methionine-rich copper-binding protein CopC